MIQKNNKSIESNGNINYNNYRIEIGRLEDGKYRKNIIYVNLGGKEKMEEVVIYCQGWAYKMIKEEYPEADVIMHKELPKKYIAVVVDKDYLKRG